MLYTYSIPQYYISSPEQLHYLKSVWKLPLGGGFETSFKLVYNRVCSCTIVNREGAGIGKHAYSSIVAHIMEQACHGTPPLQVSIMH